MMSKKIHEFNDMIRKLRKELFGKGPERIHTVFVDNMAVSTLYGNLTASEQFIASTSEGREMVHAARTTLIQKHYSNHVPEGMEQLIGAKLEHLLQTSKFRRILRCLFLSLTAILNTAPNQPAGLDDRSQVRGES